MMVSRNILRDLLQDVQDPRIIKYSAISICCGLLVVFSLTNLLLVGGLQAGIDALQNHLGGIHFDGALWATIISFFLFPFVLPLLSALIFPTAMLFQVLCSRPFSLAYQRETLKVKSPRAIGLLAALWIVIKWTLLKVFISLVFFPILHIPFIGPISDLLLTALWGTVIYFDIIAKAHIRGSGYWRYFFSRFSYLMLLSFVAVGSSYAMLWLIGFISIVVPPFSHFALVIVMVSVIGGNYMLMAEFLRDFNGNGGLLLINNNTSS